MFAREGLRTELCFLAASHFGVSERKFTFLLSRLSPLCSLMPGDGLGLGPDAAQS